MTMGSARPVGRNNIAVSASSGEFLFITAGEGQNALRVFHTPQYTTTNCAKAKDV
jgi:hypothetical protein